MIGTWRHWYFSFEVEAKDKDWRVTDSTVITAKGDKFPIQLVYENAIREFGKDIKITILSAFEISEADNGYMLNLIAGGEDEDEPETGI